MIWRFLHLSFKLPPEWEVFALEVGGRLLEKNPKSSGNIYDWILLPHEAFQEFSTSFVCEELRFGTLWMSREEKKIIYRPKFSHHVPSLIGMILLKIIKRWGCFLNVFLCHASSILSGKQSILIPGREGRGKSTLATLSGGKVMNDDLTLIEFYRGRFFLYSLPDFQKMCVSKPFFWGGPVPLERMVLIVRDEKEYYRKAKKDWVLRELRKDRVLFLRDSGVSERVMRLLSEKVPGRVLSYHPRKSSFRARLILRDS